MSRTPLDRLNAALVGRYEIQRELGEGGMATVYLARDLKHNRSVALKVLKPELAAVVGAERFLAEIETTANLQHPNILPLFDSGEADGFLFYVMPYVEGDSLRDRLDRERQLPVDEAIRITTAVANALQHAHDRGVVHRDIKPANILVQDGQPVVGDFGIALAVGAAGGARLTETGLSVGTPYYMSPEQATGDQVLGPASDTYALAAVLYEMLTGDPPYVGSTAQAVLGKIIQGSPTPATEIRKSIPPNVDAAMRKALEKLPADRFTRVQDFALGRPEPERGVTRLPLATVEGHIPSEWLSLTPDGRGAVVSQAMEDGSLQPFYWRWEDLSRTMLPGVETRATDPFISPSGDEVAYFDAGALRAVPLAGGIYVRPFPDVDGGRWQVSSGLAIAPRWSADGSEIFFASPAGMFAATVAADAGFAVQRTEHLFEWPDQLRFAVSLLTSQWYDVTPDGERFLIAGAGGVDETGNGAEPRLILVQSFFEELERRLPHR